MRRLLLLLLAALALVPGAQAKSEGPCTITFQGMEAATLGDGEARDAIPVAKGDDIRYRIESDAPLRAYAARVHYGPAQVPFHGEATGNNTTVVEGAIPSARYEWIAGGLYRVEVEVTRADGQTCTASVLIHVQGPIVNAITVAAGAVGVVGVWAIWTSLLQMFAQTRDYVDAVRDYREGRRMV